MEIKNILNLILSIIFLLLTITFSISAKLKSDHRVGFIIGAIVCGIVSIVLVCLAITIETPPEKKDEGSVPKQSVPEFLQFTQETSTMPWCIATKYKFAYVVNGVMSNTTSPEAGPIVSTTQTNPVFGITNPSGSLVQWFRSVAGNGWELFDGMELQANGMYLDTDNPCTTKFKPPAPLIAPMIQPDGWTQIAGEGLLPWCLGTKYMVRYRVGESIGDWGPASATISSSTFTFPKLVDTENSNYVKEWGRVLVGRVYVPAVLQFTVSGQSNVQYPKNFVFDGVDSNGTLSTSSFVSQWNAQDFGQFSVLPDGRLQLDLTGYRSSRNILLGDPIRQFFLRLGFDYHIFNIVDGPFVATTVPTLEVVYVGGSEFIDINNPCKIPNGPLNAPSSGGWLTTF